MRVWLIDDKVSLLQARSYCPEGAEVVVSEPDGDDLVDRLNEVWDLILVDEDFERQPGAPPTVFDGTSLVGWLRAEARRTRRQLPPLAMFTSQPDLFAAEVPAVGPARPLGGDFVGREPHIAPVIDVEWLFVKPTGADKPKVIRGMDAIASAQRRARDTFGADGASFDEVVTFLDVPGQVAWRNSALISIERARPPISEGPQHVQTFRGPVAMVRWLLHEVLPFPGNLLSDRELACRLGVGTSAIAQFVQEPATAWAAELGLALYRGPAADLFPRRWWAAGVADAALRLRTRIREGVDAKTAMTELSGIADFAMLKERDPVAVVDEHLVETSIANAANCVQLRPRGWPAQSDDPWMRVSLARSQPWLRHMVDRSDHALVASDADA